MSKATAAYFVYSVLKSVLGILADFYLLAKQLLTIPSNFFFYMEVKIF